MDDIKVYARVYTRQAEARHAYEQAVRTYVGEVGLEVGFTLALLPGVGWIVAVAGRDASSGMLEGGHDFELPEEVRRFLLERFMRNRPSAHGTWIVRKSFPEGLAVRLHRLH